MEASPAPSTSQNQQRQVAPPTGPQIRSRITVVCAECKRLKLKCDRRSPCGSCIKRDTVARCIYSPAAAEKVDLHSLNNRLIQVEGLLAALLGQGIPFPSANPLVPSSLGSAGLAPLIGNLSSLPHAQGQAHHVHHHHSSAPALSSDSISLTPQDFASIWLDDLGVALSVHPAEARSFANDEHAGQIKLEPAPFDVELSRMNESVSSNVIDVDQAPPSAYPSFDPSPSTPLRRESVSTPARPNVHILLPALSIYYPVPTIPPPATSIAPSAAFPSRPTVNAAVSSSLPTPSANNGFGLAPTTSASPQHVRPQVTPALLQLLPPVSTCEQYLENAHDVVFSVRPVPFQHGWQDFKTRCLALLTDDGQLRLEKEMKRERRERDREKAREARLARKVYFSGIHGLQDTEMDDGESSTSGAGPSRNTRPTAEVVEDEHSLPFFAAMCNVLAIGAFVTPASASFGGAAQDAPSFLHALAQQAVGVWDTVQAGATHPQHESEKLDHVLACLLGCGYMLLSTAAKRGLYGDDEPTGSPGSAYARSGLESPIVALVGKLVSAARSLDLGGETVSGVRRSGIALSVSTDGSSSGKQTRKEKEVEKERLKEEWKRAMWWEVMWYDLFTTDAFGHQTHIPPSTYALAQPPPCAAYPPSALPPSLFILPGDDDNDDNDDGDALENGAQVHLALPSSTDDPPQMPTPSPQNIDSGTQLGDAYLGARHRLIQLVHRVKSRLAQPDCCCGYTLDQAATLEGQVRQWQSALPLQLRHSSVEDSGQEHPSNISVVDKVLVAQTCELAVIANLLVIRVYAPFLRKQTPAAHTVLAAGAGPLSVNPPASLATLRACQAITRAMGDLHGVYFSSESKQSAYDRRKSEVLPCLFDMYPPEKVVFDSVVVCAHTALIPKGGVSTSDIAGLAESVTAGLGLLANAPLAASHRKIVDALRARIGAFGGVSLKRKHSQVDMSPTFTVDHLPQSAANGTIVPEAWPAVSSEQQPSAYQNHVASTTQPYHNPIIQLQPSSPVVTATPTSTAFPRNPEVKLRGEDKPERPAPPVVVPSAPKQNTTPAKASVETSQKDGQKEKKAKKSAPTVGVRVRPGKQPDKSRANPQQPLMTLAPRLNTMPTAESIRLFKQKLQLQTGASKPPIETSGPSSSTPLQEQDAHHKDATMRSRSSSISIQPHEHRPEAINPYPQFFNQQAPTEMPNNHGVQANSFSHVQQQPKQQPQASAEIPQGHFAHPTYNAQSMEFRNHAFENTPTTNGASSSDSMNYSSNVSSPFTNPGPPQSESSSPFTAGSMSSPGNPSTPAFTTHPSLPVFGPQPDMSLNSAGYVQIQPTGPFDSHYGPISATYGGQHQQAHTGPSLSDVVMDQSMGATPMYGNSQHQQHHSHQMQGAPFEMKPGVDPRSQADVPSHHSMHQQTANDHRPGEADHDMSHQSHHGSMDMTVAGPWPGPNHPQMQEHPPPLEHSYQWNNGGQYQFYH